MSLNIIEKAEGFLLRPVETFREAREDNIGDATKFYIALLLIYSVFIGILVYSGMANPMESIPGMDQFTGATGALALLVITFVSSLISIFVAGALLHIFVHIAGGRKGIRETIKAAMYGSTPSLLFGWIPFIGIIFTIWSIVLQFLGIREFHEISTKQTLIAAILLVVASVLIGGLIAVAAVVYFISNPTIGGI